MFKRATIFATILMILAFVGASTAALAGSRQSSDPTVTTDKSDYAPGETANISGSGWYPNQSVTLQVVHTDGTAEGGEGHEPWTVTSDGYGNISATWFVAPDDSLGSSFKLTAFSQPDGMTALSAVAFFTDKSSTTTVVAANVNPSTYGQSVTFTATVTGAAAPTPSGTITFSDGATTIGTGTLSGSGNVATATFTTSILLAGAHTIKADFNGDTNYTKSSGTLTQNVNQAATVTTIVSSLNPSNQSQNVTFTATVSGPGALSPTGTVTFKDGATTLGTGTLSAGQATFSTSALTVGSHNVTAVYGGDGNYSASTSSSLTQVVNARVNTSTSLNSSANPSNEGSLVTFSSTVTPVSGVATPTGTVTFSDGATTLSTVALAGGSASYGTSTLTPGTHTITAAYSGDSNFNASTSSSVSQLVKGNTTTTVASNLNPSVYSQSVTLTITVAGSTGHPSGTVTLMDGVTNLGTLTLNASSQATYTSSALSVATHPITATYNGDSTYNTSTSSTLNQVVNKIVTTTGEVSSLNPSYTGQSVTFTATVAISGPGTGTPSGSVAFTDGATTLSTVALSGNTAAFTTSSLAIGSHTVTATYSGDTNFATSNGAVTQTVNDTSTTTTLTSATNPSTYGQSVTFNSRVTNSGNGVTTGTMTYSEGATVYASGVGLNPTGRANFSISTLSAGSHTITATYSGDGTLTSSSASVIQVVNQAAATVTLSNLTQTYDGSPKPATVTTVPANLSVSVTYNGSATVPTDAGSYAVVATVNDPNYTGSASGTLLINKATAILSLSNLTQTYDGSPKSATVTTNPLSLSGVSVTYDGSSTPPTNAGSYAVDASLNNPNYQASDATGTLLINKAPATLTISGTSVVFNGSPQPVTVTTSPANLTGVTVTYDGSATAPTNAASYAVVATLNNTNYSAPDASATLVIAKADQTITFGPLANKKFGDASFNLSATASSGLTVSFAVTPPATLSGVSVSVPANGSSTVTVTVTASQAGDTNHNAAPDVTQTFKLQENVAPTSVAGSAPPANGAGWNRTDVTVTVTATDNAGGDGVKEIHYQLNGGSETVVSSDNTSFVISTEGTTTVSYWSVDNAGNAEAPNSLTVKLDKTAPDISATPDRAPDSNGWYKAPVTFTFAGSDDGSGVDASTVTSPITYSGPDSKTAFVSADASDYAGNSTHKQFPFKYDATAPVIAITGLGEHCHQSVTFGVSATDGGSGATLTLTSVLFKNGVQVSSTTVNDVLPVIPDVTLGGTTNDGLYELDVTATDEAGNVSTQAIPFEINNQAPTIDFLPASPQDNHFYNTAQTITYSVTSPAPPLTIIQKFTSKIQGADIGPVDLSSGTVAAAEGQYLIHIDATDCGGLESVKDLTFYIDATAPVVDDAALVGTFAPNPAWFKSDVGVTITANDPKIRSTIDSPSDIAGSGVKEIRYYATGAQPMGDMSNPVVVAGNTASFTVNTEGLTTITYWAVDNAGNAAAPKVVVVQYDKTAPDFTQPSDINVVATASDGAVVTFSNPTATDNVDSSPVVVSSPASGSKFGVGPTVVTVTATDAAGNQTSKTFTVNVANPVPTLTSISPNLKVYQDPAFTMTVNGDGFMPNSVVRFGGSDRVTHFGSFNQLTVDVPASDMAAAGTISVTVFTPTPGGGTSDPQTFTIDKAHQTITFGALAGKTFGDAPFTVSATATSGLPVSFSIVSGPATISGNQITITGAGDVKVRASQAGDSNWYAASDVDQTFTVDKATPVVIATGGTYTYDGNSHPATGSVTGVGGANLGTPTFTYAPGGSSDPVNAGTYGVTASFAGDANYYPASATATIIINKADQTIDFGALAGKTYGDAPFALSATATSGLPVGFSIVSGPATISGNTLTITGAGDVKVRASQPGNGNYNPAPDVCQTFTVAKFTPTVVVNGGTYTYDGNAHPATGSVTGANGEDLGSPTFDYTPGGASAPVNAGTYNVTGSYAGNGNYNPASAGGSILINKAPATINLSGLSQTYNGSARIVSATTSPLGLAGVSVTYNGSGTAPTDAGSYAIVATLTNDNYAAPEADGTLVVAKADPTIGASGGTYTYDTFAHPATGSVTGVNGENLGTPTFNYTPGGSSAPVDAGTYSATGSYAGNGNYNPGASSPVTIQINKADQTISFGALPNRTYGDPAFTVSGTASSGLSVSFSVFSGPATIAGNTVTITGAGSVTIRATQIGNGNYNAAPNVDQTFTVAKANPSLTVNGGTYTYDDQSHPATGSITGAFGENLGMPTFTYTLGGSTAPLNAGTYSVSASYAGNGNYNPAASGATIIINKASLVVTADNKSKILNAPNPTLTGSITGVQGSDGITATYSTTATLTSDAGTYPITPALVDPNGRLGNYNVTTNNGTLSVLYKNNSGILSPINQDGTTVKKQGSTVPAKFQVFDANGVSIGTPGVVTNFRMIQIISGTSSQIVDDTVDSTTPDTTFRWDPTSMQWIFNINTKGLAAGNTYVYRISLRDGTYIDFRFGLK